MCWKEKHAALLVLPDHRAADSDLKVSFFLLVYCSLFAFLVSSSPLSFSIPIVVLLLYLFLPSLSHFSGNTTLCLFMFVCRPFSPLVFFCLHAPLYLLGILMMVIHIFLLHSMLLLSFSLFLYRHMLSLFLLLRSIFLPFCFILSSSSSSSPSVLHSYRYPLIIPTDTCVGSDVGLQRVVGTEINQHKLTVCCWFLLGVLKQKNVSSHLLSWWSICPTLSNV